MSYTWPIVFSALFGAGCGVAFGYSNYQFFKDKVRNRLYPYVTWSIVLFTIYFSINKDPLFTLLFYFLPAFAVSYRYVSDLVIEQKEEEARELRAEEYRAEQLVKEEEERLERERVAELDRQNLDRRIRKLRGD